MEHGVFLRNGDETKNHVGLQWNMGIKLRTM